MVCMVDADTHSGRILCSAPLIAVLLSVPSRHRISIGNNPLTWIPRSLLRLLGLYLAAEGIAEAYVHGVYTCRNF